MFTPLTQQAIQPLPQDALAFQRYLTHHQLSLLDVALASRVRYMTVWRIAHALPVQASHAALVRAGLQRFTSIPYTAPMALLASSPQHKHQAPVPCERNRRGSAWHGTRPQVKGEK